MMSAKQQQQHLHTAHKLFTSCSDLTSADIKPHTKIWRCDDIAWTDNSFMHVKEMLGRTPHDSYFLERSENIWRYHLDDSFDGVPNELKSSYREPKKTSDKTSTAQGSFESSWRCRPEKG